jgi:hypothetical protein
MANPEHPVIPGEQGGAEENAYLNPAGGVVGRAFNAVPPEVQQMLNVKPGKTSERIKQVIAWAAAADPDVLRQHQKHDHSIHTLADIHDAPLREKDHVATHFAKQYRHRAALTGAVTALPGGLWALVGMGADVQLTAIYAVRMAAKIAQSYGYDTSIVEEQAHLADVLALAAGVDSLRGIGNWVAREGLVQLLPDVLPRVLARMSVVLTAEQTAKWAGRIIPGVAAAIGASVDYAFLRAAGERAIAHYHNRALSDAAALPAAPAPRALPPPMPSMPVAPVATAAAAMPASPSTPPAPWSAPPAVVVPSAPPAVVAPVTPVTSAPQAVSAAEAAPSRPARRRGAPCGLYLIIFAVFVIVATIIAFAALGELITSGLHQLFPALP